jgi:hypothetical protein
MSNINIKRAVDNICSGINVYTPVVELIVNGIQAIRVAKKTGGLVTASIQHSPQQELAGSMPYGDGAGRHYGSARDTDETSHSTKSLRDSPLRDKLPVVKVPAAIWGRPTAIGMPISGALVMGWTTPAPGIKCAKG